MAEATLTMQANTHDPIHMVHESCCHILDTARSLSEAVSGLRLERRILHASREIRLVLALCAAADQHQDLRTKLVLPIKRQLAMALIYLEEATERKEWPRSIKHRRQEIENVLAGAFPAVNALDSEMAANKGI